MEKYYISLQEYFNNSFSLASHISNSSFRPNYLIALWRGGSIPGCIIQEYLEYKDIPTDHIAVRTSCRDKSNNIKKDISVHGLNYITEKVTSDDNLLIVDDVFDSGLSIDTVIKNITIKSKKNTPNIKVATVYYKPENNQTRIQPDYYARSFDKNLWLVFPHECHGLSIEEIEISKGKDIKELFL